MKKMKCLFLGYNSKQTKLISFLKKKKLMQFKKEIIKLIQKLLISMIFVLVMGIEKF